jgi:hypothetical protein
MTGVLMDDSDAFLTLSFTQLLVNGLEVTLEVGGINLCEVFQHQGR